MSVFRKAVPTEYRGVRYRSKTEALVARWLDTRASTIQYWYEPEQYEVDGWRPDFAWLLRQEEGDKNLLFKECIIEVKPKWPTKTYMDALESRFKNIEPNAVKNIKALCLADPFDANMICFWAYHHSGWALVGEWGDAFDLDYRFDLAS